MVLAPTCPASSPDRPARTAPAGEGGRREEGTGRDFRVAPQEGTQTPGALRLRRTFREAGQPLSTPDPERKVIPEKRCDLLGPL